MQTFTDGVRDSEQFIPSNPSIKMDSLMKTCIFQNTIKSFSYIFAFCTKYKWKLKLYVLKCVGAVFICTEDKFPSSRLQQLIQTLHKVTENKYLKFGDNIFIEHIADVVSNISVIHFYC